MPCISKDLHETNCCFLSLYISHCSFRRHTLAMRSLKSPCNMWNRSDHCYLYLLLLTIDVTDENAVNSLVTLVDFCKQKIKCYFIFNRDNVLEDLCGQETWVSWLSIPQRGNFARCAKSSGPIQHGLVRKDHRKEIQRIGLVKTSSSTQQIGWCFPLSLSLLSTAQNSSHALLVRLTATNAPV